MHRWTKRERKQEAQARTRAQAAGGDGADDHCLPAASSCCGYSSSFTSFKKGGAEAGVQRSNQCCRMLANPNITNPNSHLDPRNPQFPSKSSAENEKGKKKKGKIFFLHLFLDGSSNRNNEEETKKASAIG